MKTISMLCAATVLAVFTGCSADPVGSFDSVAEQALVDYKKSNQKPELVSIVDKDVTKTDSLTSPYRGVVSIDVPTGHDMLHEALPVSLGYKIVVKVVSEKRLTYEQTNGAWELVSIENRIKSAEPVDETIAIPATTRQSMRVMVNGKYSPLELSDYGTTVTLVNDYFTMSKERLVKLFNLPTE